MLMEEARKELVAYGNKMVADGLAQGTSGNLSIYDPEQDLMAISPSGVPYEDTKPEDIVVMRKDGTIVEGALRPSSEYHLHAVFYEMRSEARAVVHAHAMNCTTIACLGQKLKSIHYAISDANTYEIPLVPYHTFGTQELADAVREYIGPTSRAVLLANHGMAACGSSLKSAYGLALAMEWLAELQWRCMCAGSPHYLSAQQLEGVMKRYESYGQLREDGTHPHGYSG
jgi:L-fuculose-phosphate aldolase